MSKILIVEDDGALAEELAYFLSGNGYEYGISGCS